MKIIVTGTRGIPDVMGGVETHCEELFPRIAHQRTDQRRQKAAVQTRDSHHVGKAPLG